MDRPIGLARALADEGHDERRALRPAIVLAAVLAACALGLFRTAPAFADDAGAAIKQPDAVKKTELDDGGDDVVSIDGWGDGTNRDGTGMTGKTALTDGTGKVRTGVSGNTKGTLTDGRLHTGPTGNTGTLTDGTGRKFTGKTGDTATITDGGAATGPTGDTLATDGTWKTGVTGNTAGCTDGGGGTGIEGNTGTVTDGTGQVRTGRTGNTMTATDGRG
jgi:hypothetical protein